MANGWSVLLLFFIAKAHVLLVLDHSFLDDHGEVYDCIGRWLVATAIPAGAVLHLAFDVPDPVITLMKATLGGAILLNMLTPELPPRKKARLWPFGLGAVFYAALATVFG